MKMKLSKAIVVLLLVLIAVAACGREPPFCNQPTIDSRHNFRVRYFHSFLNEQGVMELGGGDGDLYADEIVWLQRNPDALLDWRLRRESFDQEAWARRQEDLLRQIVLDISVITSADDLVDQVLIREYTQQFFERNYLVAIRVRGSRLETLAHHVGESGVVQLRPRFAAPPSVIPRDRPMPMPWVIVIELDNRFQPPEFYVEIICNPWAS